MTPAERRARLRTILDRHNDAVRTFDASNDAIDQAVLGVEDAVAGIRPTVLAVQAASRAQREAIAAILAANAAALALFNDEAAGQ